MLSEIVTHCWPLTCIRRLARLAASGTVVIQVDQVGQPRYFCDVKVINIYEAKTHLSALVERAHNGEEIILAKGGKPMARLCPIEKTKKRRAGRWVGTGAISKNFAKPLTDAELEEMGLV